MRNLRAALLFFACAIIQCCKTDSPQQDASEIGTNRRSLKSFTDRYALPTTIYPVTSQLPFAFGYRFTDDYGTMQSREEHTEPNGSKTGSYSFVDAKGLFRRVEYVADKHGFRATVTTNEPGTLSSDPAHVRMRAEGTKNNHVSLRQAVGSYPQPQMEYSSNVFASRTPPNSKSNLVDPEQSLDFLKQRPTFGKSNGFGDIEPPPASFYDSVRSYKGGPGPVSPPVRPLLLDGLAPAVSYVKSQRLNSHKFFRDPSKNTYDGSIPDVGYKRPIPTRYPRRYRDSRIRSKRRKSVLKVHIPEGFENHPDLPLYRDK